MTTGGPTGRRASTTGAAEKEWEMEIGNRVALVSGGASGLGQATARRLLAAGARVVIGDRDQVRGAALADELGASARFVAMDVTKIETVQAAVAAALDFGDFRIAVNFSRRQLCEPSLIDDLLRVTDESNLTPDRLAVEVTESSVVADADQVTDVLRTIRERGCNVYMDDFGTGLSSLSSLHSMPFDAVKIDRAFMRHITEQRHHAAIVMSIVMLAHNLGLGVIGEGIESVDQLVQLQASDCDMGQGYLFSRPLNAHDVPDWIASEGVQWRQIRQAA